MRLHWLKAAATIAVLMGKELRLTPNPNVLLLLLKLLVDGEELLVRVA